MTTRELVLKIIDAERNCFRYGGATESSINSCVELVDEHIKREIEKTLPDTKLRQWAIEQAVKSGNQDVVARAKVILDFVKKENEN